MAAQSATAAEVSLAPREFFERADDVFRSTRERTGCRACDNYLIGGVAVGVEVASDEIAPGLTSALQHLRTPATDEHVLKICAWDSARTGTAMVSPAWSGDDFVQRGEIRGYNDAGFRTAFDHGSSSLSMLDRESRTALWWTRDARLLPLHERAAPFRTIPSWFAEDTERVLVHCSAVDNGEGAILFAGGGGSGKSTTALRCAAAGWSYLADDYCLVETSEPPRVFSLYNSAKLTHDSARKFGLGEVLPSPHASDGNKDLFFLGEGGAVKLAMSERCRAVLLPRVTAVSETTLEAASSGEALRAIAPSSIFQLSGAGAVSFHRLAQLVRNVPVFRLNLGSDFNRIPDAIERSLRTA